MRKKYIILTTEESTETSTVLVKYFTDNKFGYWHWINNVWLLDEGAIKRDKVEIRDAIGKLLPSFHFIVMDMEKPNWTARGDDSPANNMFTWLQQNWE